MGVIKPRKALFNVMKIIDDANTNDVPITELFMEDFNRCISKLNISNPKPSKYYKPSSLNCLRNMYYYRTEQEVFKQDQSPDMVGICESGTDRHKRIQSVICAMKDFDIDCEYVDVGEYIKEHNIPNITVVKKSGFETHLKHNILDLSFLLDGIIKYKGKYYILEIKTESSYKFSERSGVAEEHIKQATAYSYCLGLNDVLFLYENRDFCNKKCYLYTVTDEQRKDFVNLIETCEGYVNSGIVPPIPKDVSKKTCSYCLYKPLCKKDK